MSNIKVSLGFSVRLTVEELYSDFVYFTLQDDKCDVLGLLKKAQKIVRDKFPNADKIRATRIDESFDNIDGLNIRSVCFYRHKRCLFNIDSTSEELLSASELLFELPVRRLDVESLP